MSDYECHVTTNMPSFDRLGNYHSLAAAHGWSTSWIDGDPLLGDRSHFYFTCHSDNYDEIFDKMWALEKELGLAAIRLKIEMIVFDTKKERVPTS